MTTKRAVYDIAEFKASPDENGHRGEFEALVSVFGNVDLQGDRVVKGAFKDSLARWREKGDPIPIIWSHDWANPQAHIGAADPNEVEETEAGLKVKGRIDLDNPFAAQVYRLLKERRVREFSFGYSIIKEKPGKDGANELAELDIIEAGPTLKGANQATELLAVKAALEEAAAAESKEEDSEGKAGRRISRATESELSSAIDGMEKELHRLRGLLSAGDSEEEDKDDDQTEGKSSTPEGGDQTDGVSVVDDDLLIFKTRIERMRD